MKINITGRHLDVTPAMKKYTQDKVEKLGRFYDRIHDIEAILSEEGDRQLVEVKAHVGKGTTLVGKAESTDIYAALDLVVGKLERQITRYKEKLRTWKGRGASQEAPQPPEPAEETEVTYEDVVRELTTGED